MTSQLAVDSGRLRYECKLGYLQGRNAAGAMLAAIDYISKI